MGVSRAVSASGGEGYTTVPSVWVSQGTDENSVPYVKLTIGAEEARLLSGEAIALVHMIVSALMGQLQFTSDYSNAP